MPAPTYSVTPLLSHGSTVRVGRGDTPTWTGLTGLQTVAYPDQMPADIDITNQASAGLTEENMPGLLPAVDWALEMIYDAGSASDTVLEALNARDGTTGEKELHLVEINVGTGDDKKTLQTVGYLKDYKPTGELKGKVMMTATWRLMARVTA